MRNVLVFGGTRFFGKRLVARLLARGDRVTIATRGQAPDPFGDRVERLVLDREDRTSLSLALGSRSFDLVFDNICYAPSDAAAACDCFSDRVARYVHTSTQSVYKTDGLQRESDFDPHHYPVKMGKRADFDYGEGKRLAEAVFFSRARFPVAAARIPIVLGPDDYTGRLDFHVRRVRDGLPIVIPNREAATSFISSEEAARFLEWLGDQSFTGPLNACSDGEVTIGEILRLCEEATGRKAGVASEGLDENRSPFIGRKTRHLDNAKARSLGFAFSRTLDWLPPVISAAAT